MKKLLSLLGSMSLTVTASTAVVACGNTGTNGEFGDQIEVVDINKLIKVKDIKMVQEEYKEQNQFALLKELAKVNMDAFLNTDELVATINIATNNFSVRPKPNSIQYTGNPIKLNVTMKGEELSDVIKNQTIKVPENDMNNLEVVSNEIFKGNKDLNQSQVSISKLSSGLNNSILYNVERIRRSEIYFGDPVIISIIKAPIKIEENIKNKSIAVPQELLNNYNQNFESLLDEVIKANKEYRPTQSDLELTDITIQEEPNNPGNEDITKVKLTATLKAKQNSQIYNEDPVYIEFKAAGENLSELIKVKEIEVPNSQIGNIDYILDNSSIFKDINKWEINASIKKSEVNETSLLIIDRKENSKVYKNNTPVKITIKSQGSSLKELLDKYKDKNIYQLSMTDEQISGGIESVLIKELKEHILNVSEHSLPLADRELNYDLQYFNPGFLNDTHIIRVTPKKNSTIYFGETVSFNVKPSGMSIDKLVEDANIENGAVIINNIRFNEVYNNDSTLNEAAIIEKVISSRGFSDKFNSIGLTKANFKQNFNMSTPIDNGTFIEFIMERRSNSELISGTKQIKLKLEISDKNITTLFENIKDNELKIYLDDAIYESENLQDVQEKIRQEMISTYFSGTDKESNAKKELFVSETVINDSSESLEMWKNNKSFLLSINEDSKKLFGKDIVVKTDVMHDIASLVTNKDFFIKSSEWNLTGAKNGFFKWNPKAAKFKDELNFESFDNGILRVTGKNSTRANITGGVNIKVNKMEPSFEFNNNFNWEKLDGPSLSGTYSKSNEINLNDWKGRANNEEEFSEYYNHISVQNFLLEMGGQTQKPRRVTELELDINNNNSSNKVKLKYINAIPSLSVNQSVQFNFWVNRKDNGILELNMEAELTSRGATSPTFFTLKMGNIKFSNKK